MNSVFTDIGASVFETVSWLSNRRWEAKLRSVARGRMAIRDADRRSALSRPPDEAKAPVIC